MLRNKLTKGNLILSRYAWMIWKTCLSFLDPLRVINPCEKCCKLWAPFVWGTNVFFDIALKYWLNNSYYFIIFLSIILFTLLSYPILTFHIYKGKSVFCIRWPQWNCSIMILVIWQRIHFKHFLLFIDALWIKIFQTYLILVSFGGFQKKLSNQSICAANGQFTSLN